MGEALDNIFIGEDSLEHVSHFIFSDVFSQIFVLVDENTFKHCYPQLKPFLPSHHIIKIKSGEKNKTLPSCELIWKKLTDKNADRSSLLINLGGGIIGDIGGFAAGCYKRGVKFINVPTTLLAMVDASVGSKTGIDFLNFKNQIGLFNEPQAVFIYTGFLKTLSDRELHAGFAEVIKHYLIADGEAFVDLSDLFLAVIREEFDIRQMDWDALVERNVFIKSSFVAQDKFETGNRKALNFGHTIGHAMETYFLNTGQKILHGEAVGIGILCESRFTIPPGPEYAQIQMSIICLFRNLPFLPKKDIRKIIKLIQQDKKSISGKNQFTLLSGIGDFSINNFVEDDIIADALEYYYELTRTW